MLATPPRSTKAQTQKGIDFIKEFHLDLIRNRKSKLIKHLKFNVYRYVVVKTRLVSLLLVQGG